jgi:hypothetical protein
MYSIEDNNSANNTPNHANVASGPINTSLIKRYKDSLTTIIIVPLHEILDNIYQLLSHGPTCQSSLSFARMPSTWHHEGIMMAAPGEKGAQ